MKKADIVTKGKGYTAVNIGSFDNLGGYSLIHPKTKLEIKGKVFLKELTESTGTEISFNVLPPKTELNYFHKHFKNEETYVILKGTGFFQVNDDCFLIKEGSVIRIGTEATHGLKNDGDEPMIFMVIQSKENSLGEYTTDDGVRTEFNPRW